MEDSLRMYLLSLSRLYAKKTGYALTTVSRRLHGNEYFLEEFAIGKTTVTLRKYDEMIKTLRERWPNGVKFPQCKIVMKSTGEQTR